MKVLICGPALPESAELLMPGASPAAAKYLRYMALEIKEKGYSVKTFHYVTVQLSDAAKFELDNDKSNVYVAKSKYMFDSLVEFRKKLLNDVEKGDIVLFYNISYATWLLPNLVEKKGGKAVLILADHTSSIEEKSIVRKILARITEMQFNYFKRAIILSSNARKLLSDKCQILLLEGGINTDNYENFSVISKNGNKVLLYSGMLSKVTGVDLLIEAFGKILNANVELWITGKGELTDLVVNAAKNDSRIKYFGFVSNEKYYSLLEQANIVINPRNMDFEQNQNNFPSKVLEYLASGRLVLSTRFPGYEKFEKFFMFSDSTAEALKLKIEELLGSDEEIIKEQYYVNRSEAENYSWKNQAIEMINFWK